MLPKGTLIEECGAMFQEAGYKIRSFNTFELDKSDHYNPLKYVKTDVDILKFVRFLIKNTKGGDEKGSAADPFWEDAETLLLTGLIAYLRDWCNPDDYTISGLLTLLSLAEARDEDENFKSALDYLFDEIETGRTWVMDERGQTDYNEQARWAELADDTGYHLVPSTLKHNTTGMRPYRVYCEKNGVKEANQRAREKMRAIKEHVMSRATEDVSRTDGRTTDEVRRDAWQAYLDKRGYRLQADMLNALIAQEREMPGGTGVGPDDDLALKYYRDFKTAASKTLRSILVSCNVRVAPFAVGGVRELLSFDEMDIDSLGSGERQKTVIFAIMEDTDDTLSFVLAMLMWQIVNHLCSIALTRHHGSLPAPVNILLDEFGNLGYLNGIERSIAVCRSRNIFLSPVVQDLSQIKKVYDENTMRTILACCDVKLFLGGDELETTKYFSELLGRQSITQRTFNQTRGQNANYTHNYNTLGRSLMEADEIGRMDSDRCIVKIRGFDPILDRKYRLERHPNYGLLYGEGNTRYTEPFDFREYRKTARC
jgi:type IV secretory pathway TraG/TraD family ATPase VirD4